MNIKKRIKKYKGELSSSDIFYRPTYMKIQPSRGLKTERERKKLMGL
jgi:hypothetical protein